MDDALRRQVERLIIENRNSLNDPTTNEPYDVKGIADDVIELFQAREQQLLTELLKQVRPYLDKGHLVDALPVAAIERLQNKTNDGGSNGGL